MEDDNIAGPGKRELPIAGPELQPGKTWTIVAYNKRVLEGWLLLCKSTPANARHCYEWLTQHATRIKPRRCYPLKGEVQSGNWAYEIGSGDRVYYKPIEAEKKVIVFYAGPHPRQVPTPPKDL